MIHPSIMKLTCENRIPFVFEVCVLEFLLLSRSPEPPWVRGQGTTNACRPLTLRGEDKEEAWGRQVLRGVSTDHSTNYLEALFDGISSISLLEDTNRFHWRTRKRLFHSLRTCKRLEQIIWVIISPLGKSSWKPSVLHENRLYRGPGALLSVL